MDHSVIITPTSSNIISNVNSSPSVSVNSTPSVSVNSSQQITAVPLDEKGAGSTPSVGVAPPQDNSTGHYEINITDFISKNAAAGATASPNPSPDSKQQAPSFLSGICKQNASDAPTLPAGLPDNTASVAAHSSNPNNNAPQKGNLGSENPNLQPSQPSTLQNGSSILPEFPSPPQPLNFGKEKPAPFPARTETSSTSQWSLPTPENTELGSSKNAAQLHAYRLSVTQIPTEHLSKKYVSFLETQHDESYFRRIWKELPLTMHTSDGQLILTGALVTDQMPALEQRLKLLQDQLKNKTAYVPFRHSQLSLVTDWLATVLNPVGVDYSTSWSAIFSAMTTAELFDLVFVTDELRITALNKLLKEYIKEKTQSYKQRPVGRYPVHPAKNALILKTLDNCYIEVKKDVAECLSNVSNDDMILDSKDRKMVKVLANYAACKQVVDWCNSQIQSSDEDDKFDWESEIKALNASLEERVNLLNAAQMLGAKKPTEGLKESILNNGA